MNIAPAKQRQTDVATPKTIARELDDSEDSARVGLLRITRPLGLSPDLPGGDPYNSTGRFIRDKD